LSVLSGTSGSPWACQAVGSTKWKVFQTHNSTTISRLHVLTKKAKEDLDRETLHAPTDLVKDRVTSSQMRLDLQKCGACSFAAANHPPLWNEGNTLTLFSKEQQSAFVGGRPISFHLELSSPPHHRSSWWVVDEIRFSALRLHLGSLRITTAYIIVGFLPQSGFATACMRQPLFLRFDPQEAAGPNTRSALKGRFGARTAGLLVGPSAHSPPFLPPRLSIHFVSAALHR
jgi:hypothetical protein